MGGRQTAPPDSYTPTAEAMPEDDGAVILTISGDGVTEESTWTLKQLQNLLGGYREITYSTTNNWPAFGWIEARGVSLPYLLEQAGASDEAVGFVFIAADGYRSLVTRDQLFGDRFSYVSHSAAGSSGAFIVEPVIAWVWGDAGKAREEAIRPFFGQSGPWDVNTASFVKDLCRIEVSTGHAGVWASPTADIPDGSVVPAGAELSLAHENMDSVRIYFTLDGTEPDYDSLVFNQSTSYFQPQMIVPIELSGSMTVKAFAAGFGKDRSPTAIFHYSIEEGDIHSAAFVYFSDTQADPDTGDYLPFGSLAASALARRTPISLVVFGGDSVNDGGDTEEWAAFWNIAAPILSGLSTAAVPGNHDNHALLAEYFTYPKKAPASQGEGFFYSFDWRRIHFLMLDSNRMGAAWQADLDWLLADLEGAAARQADWRIAVMHHPLWLPVANPKDEARAETMREHFLPLLEAHGVELILCGHQHVYARSLPMQGDEVDGNKRGVVQIMAASGSKGSYSISGFDFIAARGDAPNYLLVTTEGDTLTVEAYGMESDAPFDQYTFLR